MKKENAPRDEKNVGSSNASYKGPLKNESEEKNKLGRSQEHLPESGKASSDPKFLNSGNLNRPEKDKRDKHSRDHSLEKRRRGHTD